MLHLYDKIIFRFNVSNYFGSIPADATGGEEEPVHEDATAVVVGVVGQESVPLVFLFTCTISGTSEGQCSAAINQSPYLPAPYIAWIALQNSQTYVQIS